MLSWRNVRTASTLRLSSEFVRGLSQSRSAMPVLTSPWAVTQDGSPRAWAHSASKVLQSNWDSYVTEKICELAHLMVPSDTPVAPGATECQLPSTQ